MIAMRPVSVVRFLTLILLVGVYTMPLTVQAEELPWYQIEVVLFRHNASRNLTEEFYRAAESSVESSGAVDLQSLGSNNEQATSRHYRPIPESGNSLQAIRNALNRRADYHVLGMFGWQQAGLSKNQSLPVFIKLGEARWIARLEDADGDSDITLAPSTDSTAPRLTSHALTHELEGTITLYRERYLHIQTDLRYHIAPEDFPAEQHAATNGLTIPIRHQRRARSNETHYLDHPVISLIVRITAL